MAVNSFVLAILALFLCCITLAAGRESRERVHHHGKNLEKMRGKPLTRADREELRKEVVALVDSIIGEIERNASLSAEFTPKSDVKRVPNEKEILLLGDSLLGLPSLQFQVEDMLQKELTKREPNFIVKVPILCSPGANVVSMLRTIQAKFANRIKYKKPMPNAVIIYWDSDIVDVEEPNDPGVKKQYIRNLVLLLKALQAELQYVAIGGPTFSKHKGELPEEWKRDETYEVYVMIHQEVSNRLKIDHINTRRRFQDYIVSEKDSGKIPKELHKVKDWKKFREVEGGILTFDGQHTHELGTQVLVGIFADYLQNRENLWINSP